MRATTLVLFTFIATFCATARADAVTVRDIVELSRAGLSDEVIVALIETDATIFSLDAKHIMDLRSAGVSERVILAMLKSGRQVEPHPPVSERPLLAPDPPPPPQVIVEERVVPVPVPMPVVISTPLVVVPRRPNHIFSVTDSPGGFGRFINDGWRPETTIRPEPQNPFWGWGGWFKGDGATAPPKDAPKEK